MTAAVWDGVSGAGVLATAAVVAAGLGFAAAFGGLVKVGSRMMAACFFASAASWGRCFAGFAATWDGWAEDAAAAGALASIAAADSDALRVAAACCSSCPAPSLRRSRISSRPRMAAGYLLSWLNSLARGNLSMAKSCM